VDILQRRYLPKGGPHIMTPFGSAFWSLGGLKCVPHLENTIFLETELELADFEGAHIIGANFTKAYLVHSRLDAQNPDGAVFCATIMFDATENNRDC
ncbi:MAG: pentapeptide repeat-containing protein, partial [Paracoccaceae bacterium]